MPVFSAPAARRQGGGCVCEDHGPDGPGSDARSPAERATEQGVPADGPAAHPQQPCPPPIPHRGGEETERHPSCKPYGEGGSLAVGCGQGREVSAVHVILPSCCRNGAARRVLGPEPLLDKGHYAVLSPSAYGFPAAFYICADTRCCCAGCYGG